MLINATHAEETRVGIVDGQKLVDIDIETSGREQRKSNIYKGIITRIEPSLEACFIDYGEERHGFLPFKEVSRSYFKEGVDVRTATIREALTEGQELIVQVEKEERGNKGAALTTFISLAGRYLVLMPNNPRGGGVSRRIEGEERQELREAMDKLDLPAGMSTIARTAGIGRSVEELQWDLNYLLKLWSAISEAATPQYEYTVNDKGRTVRHYTTESVRDGKPLKRANPAPFLIVEESNLVIRAIRDYFQPDIGEILVDTDDIYDQARQFMAHVMPDMVPRVKRYRDETPLFSRFQIEHQIETAYSRTVPLPSGGAIVIDHTEALVAVDVNSARATRGADIEETALRTNLEAADEVARQMRLRDLGGLIVIDFIDMSERKNQSQIEQRLKEAIRPDRARVQVGKISRFGLMELSRQRLRPSLSEGSHITCPRCNGVGVIRDTESSALQVLRILQEEASKEGTGALHAQVPVDVATYILNEKRQEVSKIESRYKVSIVLIPNTSLETPHYHIERLRADDERLDDDLASYKRAEDLSPVADDPYALKSANDEAKSQRPKQVPVIKSILPQDVAPAHTPRAPKIAEGADKKRAAEAPAPKSEGFFTKILSFFGLGGSEAEKKPAAAPEKKEDAEKKPVRGDRRGKGRGRSRDEARAERGAGDKRRTPRGERAERGERGDRAERPERAERRGRPNRDQREKVEDKQLAAQVEETTEVKAAKAAAPAAAEAQEARTEERRQRRSRRPRREDAPADEAAAETTVSTQETTPAEAAETAAPAVKAETEETAAAQAPEAAEDNGSGNAPRARGERRSRKPRAEKPAKTEAEAAAETAAGEGAEPAAPAVKPEAEEKPQAVEPAATEAADDAAQFSDAPENDAEPVIESDSRRRRPRRRRRSTRVSETTTVTAANAPVEGAQDSESKAQAEKPAAEVKEEAAAVEPAAKVKTEVAAEAVAEVKTEAVAETTAEVAAEAAQATVVEEPREVLTQIETSSEAVAVAAAAAAAAAAQAEAVAAEAAKPRRERVAPEASAMESETPLVQIETVKTPELLAEQAATAEAEAAAKAAEEAARANPVPDIAVGLAENLEKAGLTQVDTDASLCEPVTYEAVKQPGRPRPQLPDIKEEPLEQVHTDPKYLEQH